MGLAPGVHKCHRRLPAVARPWSSPVSPSPLTPPGPHHSHLSRAGCAPAARHGKLQTCPQPWWDGGVPGYQLGLGWQWGRDGEGSPSPATPMWGWGGRFPALSLPFSPFFRPSSVSDASGNLVIQEIAIRPLTQDMLQHEVRHPWDAQEGLPLLPGGLIRTLAGLTFRPRPLSQDCYILDYGGHKIFVWKGKNSTKEEKQQAMSRALVGLWGRWVGDCRSLGEARHPKPVHWLWLPPGLHQSQELPVQHQRGDGERRLRVGRLQAALPEVDGPLADHRAGQDPHRGQSG